MTDHSQCIYTALDKVICFSYNYKVSCFERTDLVIRLQICSDKVTTVNFYKEFLHNDKAMRLWDLKDPSFYAYLSHKINKVWVCCVILNQSDFDNHMPIDATFSWSFSQVLGKYLSQTRNIRHILIMLYILSLCLL